MRKKISIIGAGQVGSTAAQRIFEREYADIVLVDIVEGMPQGKALDILESGPVVGSDSQIIGTNSYEETANSDVVVITSGVARRPGMSRDDLLSINMKIIDSVTKEVVSYSPNSIIVVVTNPLDAMCHIAHDASGFPRERVIGQSGILDTARFRTFLAQELKVSVRDIQAYVLGGHGDTMVPLVGYTTVGGVPVNELIEKERLDQIVQRARDGGGEIVALLKTGSAYYAPAAGVAEMVDSIILDQHRILPCAVRLQGEYGVSDVFSGVPIKLGASGLEEVVELKLSQEEKGMFQHSVDAVHELLEAMNSIKNQA